MVCFRLCSASLRCPVPFVSQRPRAPFFAGRRSSSFAQKEQLKDGSLLPLPAFRQQVGVRAGGPGEPRTDRQQRDLDRKIIIGLCESLECYMWATECLQRVWCATGSDLVLIS